MIPELRAVLGLFPTIMMEEDVVFDTKKSIIVLLDDICKI